MSYAEGTTVPWNQSRNEIETLLARSGAEGFAFASHNGRSFIAFSIEKRAVRIELPHPTASDVSKTPTGKTRSPASIEEALAAETRRRWRSLGLVIKAKLTAVADGISTIEREFLSDIVTGNGRTVHESIRSELADSRGGKTLLLGDGVFSK